MRNLNSDIIKYLIIVILVGIIFLQRSCYKEHVSIVKLPEVKGTFDTVKPKEIPSKTKYVYTTLKGKTIYLTNPVNDSLVKEYEKATDSICKLQLYLDAISEREYLTEYDNDTINLKVYSKVQGTLLKEKPSYVIKTRSVETSKLIKEQKFAMYAGVDVFDNKLFNNFGVKASLGFQNKNKDILTFSYDTHKNFYLGYSVKLFSIKK
jgi:hypothetical protein